MSFGGFGLSQTPLGRNGTLFAFTQFGARSPGDLGAIGV
jgi:hypothetical protein